MVPKQDKAKSRDIKYLKVRLKHIKLMGDV